MHPSRLSVCLLLAALACSSGRREASAPAPSTPRDSAAARGFVDAVIQPDETRAALSLALRTALNNPGPHLGAFVLPPHLT